MKHTISARETSGNAKKSIPIVFIEPKNKIISAPDKMTFLQVCRALNKEGIELFLEGKKIKNIAPEKIPDDIEDMEE